MDTKSIKQAIEVILIFIFILILIFSCSPTKRLNKIIKKNPHLLVKDTIKIVDTILIPEYSYDTIEQIIHYDTTIIVNNERVEAKYYYDTLRQEIWHEIKCKDTAIIKDRLIPIEKVIIKELTLWEKYGTLVIFGIIIMILSKVLKNFSLL